MAQNDSSSKSSKKLKQKKVPQRGLGVAQLEKIRMEERQQKNSVLQSGLESAMQNNNPLLASDFLQNPQIGANSAFKTTYASDFLNRQLNIGQGSWGKQIWNGEPLREGGGFASSRPRANESHDSIPSFAALSGIPGKEPFQYQMSSSSMVVKVSSGTSSSSSSGLTHNQMEPSSNKSFYSQLLSSLSKLPDEEKLQMIGSKRAYPFSLDNLMGPAYPHKFPHYPVHAEPRKPLLREELASSSVRPEKSAEKVTEKKVNLNGDFLSLALPKPTSPHPTQEPFEVRSSSQENDDGPSLYNFLPSSEALDGRASNTIATSSGEGEVAEKLDLNLKL